MTAFTTESEELVPVKLACFVIRETSRDKPQELEGAETLRETDIKN